MLIALGIYLYLWLNFHWKTTGGSKVCKTDSPWSSDISGSTDLYFAWHDNYKASSIKLIIISGNLGTLKDRWNFWTFGIKVYKHCNRLSRTKPPIHALEFYLNIANHRIGNVLVASQIIAGNSKERGILRSIGTKILNKPNHTSKINTYREISQQVNKTSGPHSQSTHNARYSIQVNRKGITRYYKLLPTRNNQNNANRIYTMGPKSKANKAKNKSMKKRTMERKHALSRTLLVGSLTTASDSDDNESVDSESGSEMDTLEEPEDFNTYCRQTDFADKEHTFYHIAAAIYRLAGLKVVHPTDSELTARINEVCQADSNALSQLITEVNLLREARYTNYIIPRFLQSAEEWVRITVRDGEQEMPEAYRALGMMFKLARDTASESWRKSGDEDMDNLKHALQSLGLSQTELDALQQHMDKVRVVHQGRRQLELEEEATRVYIMLEGVAEEEANTPRATNADPTETMEAYILKHGEACVCKERSWVQVAKRHATKTITPVHGTRGTTEAYKALPGLSIAPTVMAKTLQEYTTRLEQDKVEAVVIKQRGRQHALNPPIQATNWPAGMTQTETDLMLYEIHPCCCW